MPATGSPAYDMYDLIPPKACFCGCGRSMSFGRVQSINGVGTCLREDVEVLRGEAERAPGDEEVAKLLADAEPLLEMLRDVVHGDRTEDTLDRGALRDWWQRAHPVRDRIVAAEPAAGRTAPRYTPRQVAMLHELGALSEMHVWRRLAG